MDNKDDKELGWPATNAPSNPIPTGGNPRKASNRNLVRGFASNLTRFTAGRHVSPQVKSAEQETKDSSGNAPKLRSRAEVIIYSDKGIAGIKKGSYLLLPGGGIDDGETPEFAAYREAIEEADRALLHMKPMGCSEGVWPADKKLVDGFDGERSYFFMALDGGQIGTTHEDNEEFKVLSFDDALDFLDRCAERPDQQWAAEANEIRRQCIVEAKQAADAGNTEPVKLAAARGSFDHQGVGAQGLMSLPEGYQKIDHQLWAKLRPQNAVKVRSFDKVAELTPAELHSDDPKVPDNANKAKFEAHDIAVEVANEKPISKEIPVNTAESLERSADPLPNLEDKGQDQHKTAFELSDALMPETSVKRTTEPALAAPEAVEEDDEDGEEDPIEEEPLENPLQRKEADAIKTMPRSEYVMFDPENRVYVAPDQNKRFRFPTQGTGNKAPYEPTQRFLPPDGVPEPGMHGYDVSLNVGDVDPATAPAFEGGQWMDPNEVLKSLYGSMGQKANAPYREIDRARARVIVSHLKRKRKTQTIPAPIAAPTPVEPTVVTQKLSSITAFIKSAAAIAASPLTKEDIIASLKEHGHPEVTVGGGAAMVLHGLRPDTNDIDASAPSKVFDELHTKHGKPTLLKAMNGDDMYPVPGTRIDMHRNEVQSAARSGVNARVMQHHELLNFYKALNRPKDQPWIQMLSGPQASSDPTVQNQ